MGTSWGHAPCHDARPRARSAAQSGADYDRGNTAPPVSPVCCACVCAPQPHPHMSLLVFGHYLIRRWRTSYGAQLCDVAKAWSSVDILNILMHTLGWPHTNLLLTVKCKHGHYMCREGPCERPRASPMAPYFDLVLACTSCVVCVHIAHWAGPIAIQIYCAVKCKHVHV